AAAAENEIWNIALQYDQGRVFMAVNEEQTIRVRSVDASTEFDAPPALEADVLKLSEETFEITFEDDPGWREAITSVRNSDITMVQGDDYVIEPGKITIYPNVLAPGVREIRILSTGYLAATVFQLVKP